MGIIKINGKLYGGGSVSASAVSYNGGVSGLEAHNVQTAIDSLVRNINDLEDSLADNEVITNLETRVSQNTDNISSLNNSITTSSTMLQWWVDRGYLPPYGAPTPQALINPLTSYSDGSVTISSSGEYANGKNKAWQAFDGKTGTQDDNNLYCTVSGAYEYYIDITFAVPRVVEYLYFDIFSSSGGNNSTITTLQFSDDGVTWDTCGTLEFVYASGPRVTKKLTCNLLKNKKKYRLKFKHLNYALHVTTKYGGGIDNVQLYGY